jgi:beta-lactamase class A
MPTPADISSEIGRLVAHLPSGSISVAARNLQTGAAFRYGSNSGHTSASIFKVNILQAVMLKHQASGTPLSQGESSDASVMIVTSDNDSATRLYQDVGGAAGVKAANRTLGLTCTDPHGTHWGLTGTCAEDQVQLLLQLESASSPLDQSSRDFILNLMQNVTPTQRWGVPIVADPGTTFSVKNGWLDLEQGRDWVINSIGIVTYRGQTLLIATLSQNNHTMAAGVSLDEQLAKLAAESVTVS